jgi:alkylated DNA nucleotide flippase Atl1
MQTAVALARYPAFNPFPSARAVTAVPPLGDREEMKSELPWEPLAEALERCVTLGNITCYADVARWLLSKSSQLPPVQSTVRAVRDNGYAYLAYRVVGANGFLFLSDSREQQRTQLESEGIQFTRDGRVDLDIHRPVAIN